MRLLLILSALLISSSVLADAEVGQSAPDFALKDTHGQTHALKDLKGKTVVLEWLNFDCPFVKKHYNSGNMQKLQASETAKGVIWFSIVSSAKGKQGYFTPKAMNARQAKLKGMQTAILYDSDGKVGRAYGAKNTPHMFVIDQTGNIAYRGAIDDKPSTEVEDIPTAKNYVAAALDDLQANRKIAVSDTKPYGCGVKYQ